MKIKSTIAILLASLTIGAMATGCGKKAPETKLSDSEAKTYAQKLEGTWKTNNVVWGCGNTKIVVDVASNGDTTVDLTRVVFGDIGYVTNSGCVVEDFNHHKSGNEYYKGTVSYTDSYGIWHGQYFYSNYNCDRLSLCTVVYKKTVITPKDRQQPILLPVPYETTVRK